MGREPVSIRVQWSWSFQLVSSALTAIGALCLGTGLLLLPASSGRVQVACGSSVIASIIAVLAFIVWLHRTARPIQPSDLPDRILETRTLQTRALFVFALLLAAFMVLIVVDIAVIPQIPDPLVILPLSIAFLLASVVIGMDLSVLVPSWRGGMDIRMLMKVHQSQAKPSQGHDDLAREFVQVKGPSDIDLDEGDLVEMMEFMEAHSCINHLKVALALWPEFDPSSRRQTIASLGLVSDCLLVSMLREGRLVKGALGSSASTASRVVRHLIEAGRYPLDMTRHEHLTRTRNITPSDFEHRVSSLIDIDSEDRDVPLVCRRISLSIVCRNYAEHHGDLGCIIQVDGPFQRVVTCLLETIVVIWDLQRSTLGRPDSPTPQ